MKKFFILLPLLFLAACGNDLKVEELEVVKLDQGDSGFTVVGITCKADEPIRIKSIEVNDRPAYFPVFNFRAPEGTNVLVMMSRFLPMEFFTENGYEPEILPCERGQREVIIARSPFAPDPRLRKKVKSVTIVTENRGTNVYNLE